MSLLKSGATCWRCERATRVALLLDNEHYFSAVLSSLERARRSIVILGWQFDVRTALSRGSQAAVRETQIGRLLRTLAERRPELDIRVLVWDMPRVMIPLRSVYAWRARNWFQRQDIKLLYDGGHPFGACRHQKLVIVDSSVAFCSGSDFAVNRWDAAAHLDQDARRRLPSGDCYGPRHAVSAVVAGPVARALFELSATRWHAVSGENIPAAEAALDPWPADVEPFLHDVDVAIARTEPGDTRGAEVREIEFLCLHGIAAAREIIYIEDQYFAAPRIADALAVRLAEPNGPEVIVVCSQHGPSFFDGAVMDPAKEAAVRSLQECDLHGRLGVYAPITSGGHAIVVHSKLMCIDDRLLRIGSANLNNRSLGFDSECDLAIDSHSMPSSARAEVERSIREFRLSLIAHHVGIGTTDLRRLAKRTGSTLAVIRESIRGGRARVREIRPAPLGPLRKLIARYHIGDPQSTADVWRPWHRKRRDRGGGTAGTS